MRLSVSRGGAAHLEGGDTHLPMKMWVQPCSRRVSTPSRSEAAHLKKSPKTRQKVADMMSATGGPWDFSLGSHHYISAVKIGDFAVKFVMKVK